MQYSSWTYRIKDWIRGARHIPLFFDAEPVHQASFSLSLALIKLRYSDRAHGK